MTARLSQSWIVCLLTLGIVAAVLLRAQAPTPAQDKTDFSGRWTFQRPPAIAVGASAEPARVNPADELIVTQNVAVLTVGYGPRGGTHPYGGAHFFGTRGSGSAPGTTYKSSVVWAGRELVIEVITETNGTNGARNVSKSTERWSLENDGRLVIKVSEERSGAEPITETLVYLRR